MIPRIGAFEVTYKGILIYSKFLTTVWPDCGAVAEKIGKMLTDSNNGMSEGELRAKYQIRGP